jgi:hypothetical protein
MEGTSRTNQQGCPDATDEDLTSQVYAATGGDTSGLPDLDRWPPQRAPRRSREVKPSQLLAPGHASESGARADSRDTIQYSTSMLVLAGIHR